MMSKSQAVQAFEKRRDTRAVDIGEGDAELAFPILRTGGLEHGAGQGEDGGFLHQGLGKLVRWQGVGMFNIGEISTAAEQVQSGKSLKPLIMAARRERISARSPATHCARLRMPQRAPIWPNWLGQIATVSRNFSTCARRASEATIAPTRWPVRR